MCGSMRAVVYVWMPFGAFVWACKSGGGGRKERGVNILNSRTPKKPYGSKSLEHQKAIVNPSNTKKALVNPYLFTQSAFVSIVHGKA
jgi:hypothetical protein